MLSATKLSKVMSPRVAAPRPARMGLSIKASYLWGLHPRKSGYLIDLTNVLKEKRSCSVSCKDYASKATEAIDLTIMDHGGAHLIFECTGEHPLDRPSDLYLTDVDSECEVRLDGKPLEKGVKHVLHPGAKIELGEETFTVLRNVFAHA